MGTECSRCCSSEEEQKLELNDNRNKTDKQRSFVSSSHQNSPRNVRTNTHRLSYCIKQSVVKKYEKMTQLENAIMLTKI